MRVNAGKLMIHTTILPSAALSASGDKGIISAGNNGPTPPKMPAQGTGILINNERNGILVCFWIKNFQMISHFLQKGIFSLIVCFFRHKALNLQRIARNCALTLNQNHIFTYIKL